MTNKLHLGWSLLMLALVSIYSANLYAQRNSSIADSYTLEAQGNYNGAVNIMLRLEKAAPQEPFFQLRLGWLFFQQADYVKAEEYYRRSLLLKPSLEAREGLMNSQYYQGQWLKTIHTGKQILELSSKHFSALTSVAYSYYALGDFLNAAAYYQRVTDIYPFNLEVMGYLLSSYHQSNQREKAAEIYRRLSIYSPENPFIKEYQAEYR